ncbi:MAG: polysaccharide biosynthesis/export family protein, partial [Alistipes sp.]|nr:polysaccharide biosynthesis/export family protein [Alistipes sp.]
MLGGFNSTKTRNRDNGYTQTDSRLRQRSGAMKDRRVNVGDRMSGLSDETDTKNPDEPKETNRDNERMLVPMNANYAMGSSYLLAGADSLKANRKPPVPDSLQQFGHNIFSERELTFEPNENLATPENYTLGPGDEVIIDIWGANEDFVRQEISPEGNIVVEQLGPIHLNGLTVREANDKIRRIFARKYEGIAGDDPVSDIRLSLGELRSIQVNIMGEVKTPGTYRISSFASLFHALY